MLPPLIDASPPLEWGKILHRVDPGAVGDPLTAAVEFALGPVGLD